MPDQPTPRQIREAANHRINGCICEDGVRDTACAIVHGPWDSIMSERDWTKPMPQVVPTELLERVGAIMRDDEAREARITFLETYRPTLIQYLQAKLSDADWHGVQDAASDLRDLDSELKGLRG